MAQKNYHNAYLQAVQMGVDFRKDFHAQNIGQQMAALAKKHGYKKPSKANGSTGRYFFALFQRRYNN